MRIFADTASVEEIAEWAIHPWVSGFTTNPSLMKQAGVKSPMEWAKRAVDAAAGKPISIDGPPEVYTIGDNVWRKIVTPDASNPRVNLTAICHERQVPFFLHPESIISVFAGRIMDTGRDPQRVLSLARRTGAQVLWASCREPYNLVQAEYYGCDIITVPPAILRKWFDWQGKPLERVAEETVAQFHQDREALAWT